MLLQWNTAAPSISLPDGAQPTQRVGQVGEAICAGLHGKYFTQCARGNVFIGGTPVNGVTTVIYSSVNPVFLLWNPAGSSKNLVPIKLGIGLSSVVTSTANLAMGYMLNAGAQLATASQITADSPATRAIINANLGYPQQSVAIFSITANTVAAASVVWLRTLGVPLFTGNSPMARNNYWQLTESYDGELIVGPGTALVVGGNTGAGTYDIALTWEEVPV